MKRLCSAARVNQAKVFPHNLRKLFARIFYKAEKDIAKLADVLGHGSIETTRIYIMSTGSEHRRRERPGQRGEFCRRPVNGRVRRPQARAKTGEVTPE